MKQDAQASTSGRTAAPAPNATLEQLNALLCGELSTVATYETALDQLEAPLGTAALDRLRALHARRASRLEQLVRARGGTPASAPAVRLALTPHAPDSVASAALDALNEREELTLELYAQDWSALDDSARNAVASELMPGQLRSLELLRHLRSEIRNAGRNRPGRN